MSRTCSEQAAAPKARPGSARAYDRIAARARDIAQAFLAATPSPDDLQSMVRLLTELCENVNARLARQADPPMACRSGCSWCCLLMVPVSIPEVFAMVNHLRETRTEAELDRMKKTLRGQAGRRHGLSPRKKAAIPIPCPMLRDHLCSIYEIRPLGCRGFNSLDAKACESYNDKPGQEPTPPAFAPQVMATMAVGRGLRRALEMAGLESENVEMIGAMSLAMDHPETLARWLAGDRVFAAVELPGMA